MSETQPGRGVLELSFIAGRTNVTRARATSPLKLLAPRRRGPAAWVYTSTYGGGLVAGDEIDIDIRVGPKAICVIGTQSSTKVYRNPTGLPSRQMVRATVAEGATLVLAPDPVTCFAGATYEQQQRFYLHPGGALVMIDWLTSGRRARGERWAFSRYRSRLDVYFGQEHLLADALLLHPGDGPLESPYRLGRFNCLALVVLLGEPLAEASRLLVEHVSGQPLGRGSPIIDAASPIRHGAVLRILGETAEQVGRRLKDKLCFVSEFLGESPWARKW